MDFLHVLVARTALLRVQHAGGLQQRVTYRFTLEALRREAPKKSIVAVAAKRFRSRSGRLAIRHRGDDESMQRFQAVIVLLKPAGEPVE